MGASSLRRWRFRFSLILLLLSGVLFLVSLFLAKSLLWWGLAYCGVFFALIFWAIEYKNLKGRSLLPALILIGLGMQLVLLWAAWETSLAMRISLLAIAWLYRDLRSYFINTRKIVWFTYFTQTGYLFTMITVVFFGFAVLGMSQKFPFNCQQIRELNSKITTLRHLGSSSSTPLPSSELSLSDTSGASLRIAIKERVETGLLSTQKNINDQICQVVVRELEKVYHNPIFKFAVIFAFYLLFYSIIRIVVRIITILAYFLFLILRLLGCYPTQHTLQAVEEVL